MEAGLDGIGITDAVRVDAVKDDPAILGCARSHLAVLSEASPYDDRLLLVLEDDCDFLATRPQLDAIVEEFAGDDRLDVLALANNTRWSQPISRRLAISTDIQTMAAYVVKRRALADLALSMQESVRRLVAGESPKTAANDKVWKEVQEKRYFAIPRQRVAVQRKGFSDIQNGWVDYGV